MEYWWRHWLDIAAASRDEAMAPTWESGECSGETSHEAIKGIIKQFSGAVQITGKKAIVEKQRPYRH